MAEVCVFPEPMGGELPIRGPEDSSFCARNEGTIIEEVDVHGTRPTATGGCSIGAASTGATGALMQLVLVVAACLLRARIRARVRHEPCPSKRVASVPSARGGAFLRRLGIIGGFCAAAIGSSTASALPLKLNDRVTNITTPYQLYTPEYLLPGEHTLRFPVSHTSTRRVDKRYSDVPFLGTFIGRGTDCSYGYTFPPYANGTGADFETIVGWGQVEGNGHPDANSDPCAAWVSQVLLDFDVSQLSTIPVMILERAELQYAEREAPACYVLVYTQGGFAVDPMACWTNGDAYREPKPDGCLTLGVPDRDWLSDSSGSDPIGSIHWPLPKLSASAWDVKTILQARNLPGLKTNDPKGFGFVLSGTISNLDDLTADDNTRCTSLISDIELVVTYRIPARPAAGEASPLH